MGLCGCVSAYLSLLALLEESLLANLLLGLVGGEVLGLRDLLDLLGVEAGDVDLEGGGDNVARVDPAQGNAVDLEGAGDEENALVEGLEEDDALAAEAAGDEDQDGAGLQGLAGSPGAEGLADLCCGLVSANMFIDLMPFSCSSPRRVDGCVDRRRGGRTGEFKISRPMPPTGGAWSSGQEALCPPQLADNPQCISFEVPPSSSQAASEPMHHEAITADSPSWAGRHPRQGTTSGPSPWRRGPPGSTCRRSSSGSGPTC